MSDFIRMSDFAKSTRENQQQNTNAVNVNNQNQQSANNINQTQTQTSAENTKPANTSNATPTTQQHAPISVPIQQNKDIVELNTKLENAKKQNGLVEKAADFIKGKLGLGLSSKKIQEKINNNADSKEITKDINNYRRQQESIIQAVADILVCGAVIFSFTKGRKTTLVETFKSKISGSSLMAGKENLFVNIGGALGAAYLGAISKFGLTALNRIGSDKYKIKKDENIDKEELKAKRKAMKADKKEENTRNLISGAINGLLAPVLLLGGGFVGAPLYLVLNSLNRYFVASREDSGDKSIGSYIDNLKNSPVSNIASVAAIGAMAFKKGIDASVFEKNLTKAFNDINKTSILTPYADSKTSYEKLADVLMNSEQMKAIMNDGDITKTADDLYNELSQNTFFLKILQIQEGEKPEGLLGTLSSIFESCGYKTPTDELIKKLKMDGPRTYSVEEAQKAISEAFGGKYTLAKDAPLGVGTVAETYLVKDKDGKELVVKLLKRNISDDKIMKDAEECINIIKASNMAENEKQALIKSFNDIAEGVRKEANLSNEMEAAKKLANSTTRAQVVKGIEVSADGRAYVMEKADGFCLQRVSDYIKEKARLEGEVDFIKRSINGNATGTKSDDFVYYKGKRMKARDAYEEAQKALNKYIEEHKGMEGFANLSKDEARTMLELYQDVLVEQFNEVTPKGKTIHADIHPGNIMIDINALKSYVGGDKASKSKIFTLIDTGNTIEQTPEVALRFLNLSKYIEDADVDNIINFALEGATLPSGKTKEACFEAVKKKLVGADGKSGIFFDNKTALGKLTNEAMIEGILNKVLQEEGIVPSNLQGNLIKAQTSARNSLKQFKNNNRQVLLSSLLNSSDSATSSIGGVIKTLRNSADYRAKQRRQEKANLRKLSPAIRASIKKSKSAPKKDSVEYLTYLLKQNKAQSKAQDALDSLV